MITVCRSLAQRARVSKIGVANPNAEPGGTAVDANLDTLLTALYVAVGHASAR